MLYALLKRIVSFSQSTNQSANISPNDQHLFANAVKSPTAKFAPTTYVRTNSSDPSCEFNREITVFNTTEAEKKNKRIDSRNLNKIVGDPNCVTRAHLEATQTDL